MSQTQCNSHSLLTVMIDYINIDKYLNNDIAYMEEKFKKETVLNDSVKDINISELKDKGIIERKGPDNGGKWKIR